jgi:hypothetical protein
MKKLFADLVREPKTVQRTRRETYHGNYGLEESKLGNTKPFNY